MTGINDSENSLDDSNKKNGNETNDSNSVEQSKEQDNKSKDDILSDNKSKSQNAITAIDKTSVHRICSGQVILSLGTALKELVENSVDAGATNVDIRLKEFGAASIEVVDNGLGIEERNFAGIGLKHHTSKLKEFSDLSNMETFGFRGEALSSLSALGNLTVHTRHKSCTVGYKLEFDSQGQLVKTEPAPRQVGTTVTVTKIFNSLPVRHREFTKNIKKEYAKMITILQGYSLILTGIRVSLCNISDKTSSPKQVVFATNGNQTFKENIVNLFGVKQFQCLRELRQIPVDPEVATEFGLQNVDESDIDFRIDGFISSVEHGKGRSSNDRQYFFINSRPCDSQKVFRLINEVYRLYNRHQAPFAALRVSANRSTIDINVTPDKRQMFMEKEKLFLATLKSSLINLFKNQVNLYDINTLIHCSAKLGIPFNSTITISGKSSNEDLDKGSVRSNPGKSHQSQTLGKLESYNMNKTSSLNDIPNLFTSVSESQNVEKFSAVCGSSISSQSLTHTTSKMRDNFNVIKEPDETPLTKLRKAVETRKRNSEKEEREVADYEDEEVPPKKMMKLEEEDFVSLESEREVCDLDFTDNHDEGIKDGSRMDPNIKSANGTSFILDSPLKNRSQSKKSSLILEFNLETLKKKVSRNNDKIRLSSTSRHSLFRTKIDPSKNEEAEAELRREITKDKFLKMQILGQFNLGFIITRLGNDLFIIDQHATDEKYNFETLQTETVIKSQKLILPQVLSLSPSAEITLQDNIEIFTKNGFEFAIDDQARGGERVKMVSVPMSKDWNFGVSDVEEMIFMLSELNPGTLVRPSRIRKMFASRACRKSVMIGTPLTSSEMKRLVDHMAILDHPWNCPHGRPTMRHLINLSILPD